MALEDSDFEDKANSPRKVTTDEGTVEERTVEELIKAERHTANRSSSQQVVPFGMSIARTKPGGTV
jgi:hypothetical protein